LSSHQLPPSMPYHANNPRHQPRRSASKSALWASTVTNVPRVSTALDEDGTSAARVDHNVIHARSRRVGEHRTYALAATANAPLDLTGAKEDQHPLSRQHKVRLSPHHACRSHARLGSPQACLTPARAARGLRKPAPTKHRPIRAKAAPVSRRGPAVAPGA
jgi:hypothetical protein